MFSRRFVGLAAFFASTGGKRAMARVGCIAPPRPVLAQHLVRVNHGSQPASGTLASSARGLATTVPNTGNEKLKDAEEEKALFTKKYLAAEDAKFSAEGQVKDAERDLGDRGLSARLKRLVGSNDVAAVDRLLEQIAGDKQMLAEVYVAALQDLAKREEELEMAFAKSQSADEALKQLRSGEAKPPKKDISTQKAQEEFLAELHKYFPNAAKDTADRKTHPFPLGPFFFHTRDREHDYSMIMELWARNKKVTVSKSKRYGIVSLVAPPGAGKSHVATVVAAKGLLPLEGIDEKQSREWVQDDDFMTVLAKQDARFRAEIENAVGVTVSFNFRTSPNGSNNEEDADHEIAARLLHSHFHRGEWAEFCTFLKTNGFTGDGSLTVEAAMEMIRRDIGEGKRVIVVLDELVQLINSVQDKRRLEREAAFRVVLRLLKPVYESGKDLLLLTTLNRVIMETQSSTPIHDVDMGTLSMQEVREMVRRDAPDVSDKLENGGYGLWQHLLNECAGLPRLVQNFVEVARQSTKSTLLSEMRDEMCRSLHGGKWHDKDKKKRACRYVMGNLDVDAIGLWNAGYLYRGPDLNEPRFRLPPLILRSWESDSGVLLESLHGFIDHSHSLRNQEQARDFEMQIAHFLRAKIEALHLAASEKRGQDPVLTMKKLLNLKKDQGPKLKFNTEAPKAGKYASDEGERKDVVTSGEPCQPWVPMDPANPGFDVAIRFETVDRRNAVLLVEVKMWKGWTLSATTIGQKFANALQEGGQIRPELVELFNEGRLVYAIGGMVDIRCGRGNAIHECIEQISQMNEKNGTPLQDIERNVRRSLVLLPREHMVDLLGPSLMSLFASDGGWDPIE